MERRQSSRRAKLEDCAAADLVSAGRARTTVAGRSVDVARAVLDQWSRRAEPIGAVEVVERRQRPRGVELEDRAAALIPAVSASADRRRAVEAAGGVQEERSVRV